MKTMEMRLGEYRITGKVAEDGGIVIQASSSQSNLIEAEMKLGPTASDRQVFAESERAEPREVEVDAPHAGRSSSIEPGPV